MQNARNNVADIAASLWAGAKGLPGTSIRLGAKAQENPEVFVRNLLNSRL
jgi:hypothetical protein